MSDEFDVGEDTEVGATGLKVFGRRLSPRAIRRIQAGPAVGAQGVGVVLPLGSATFDKNTATMQLAATVEEAFAIEDFVLDIVYNSSWDGGVWAVSNIRVGVRPLLAGTEEFPIGLFASTSQRRPAIGRGLVVRPGKEIKVDFTLVGPAATAGAGAVIGAVIGSAR